MSTSSRLDRARAQLSISRRPVRPKILLYARRRVAPQQVENRERSLAGGFLALAKPDRVNREITALRWLSAINNRSACRLLNTDCEQRTR